MEKGIRMGASNKQLNNLLGKGKVSPPPLTSRVGVCTFLGHKWETSKVKKVKFYTCLRCGYTTHNKK